MTARGTRTLVVALAAWIAACSPEAGGDARDGSDGSPDVPADFLPDSPTDDAASETPPDAPPDAPLDDGPSDVPPDTEPDAPPDDAGPDGPRVVTLLADNALSNGIQVRRTDDHRCKCASDDVLRLAGSASGDPAWRISEWWSDTTLCGLEEYFDEATGTYASRTNARRTVTSSPTTARFTTAGKELLLRGGSLAADQGRYSLSVDSLAEFTNELGEYFFMDRGLTTPNTVENRDRKCTDPVFYRELACKWPHFELSQPAAVRDGTRWRTNLGEDAPSLGEMRELRVESWNRLNEEWALQESGATVGGVPVLGTYNSLQHAAHFNLTFNVMRTIAGCPDDTEPLCAYHGEYVFLSILVYDDRRTDGDPLAVTYRIDVATENYILAWTPGGTLNLCDTAGVASPRTYDLVHVVPGSPRMDTSGETFIVSGDLLPLVEDALRYAWSEYKFSGGTCEYRPEEAVLREGLPADQAEAFRQFRITNVVQGWEVSGLARVEIESRPPALEAVLLE